MGYLFLRGWILLLEGLEAAFLSVLALEKLEAGIGLLLHEVGL